MLTIKDGVLVSDLPLGGKGQHVRHAMESLDDIEAAGRGAGEKAGRDLCQKFPLGVEAKKRTDWLLGLFVALEQAQVGLTVHQANAWLAGFDAGFRPHLRVNALLWGEDLQRLRSPMRRWGA